MKTLRKDYRGDSWPLVNKYKALTSSPKQSVQTTLYHMKTYSRSALLGSTQRFLVLHLASLFLVRFLGKTETECWEFTFILSLNTHIIHTYATSRMSLLLKQYLIFFSNFPYLNICMKLPGCSNACFEPLSLHCWFTFDLGFLLVSNPESVSTPGFL